MVPVDPGAIVVGDTDVGPMMNADPWQPAADVVSVAPKTSGLATRTTPSIARPIRIATVASVLRLNAIMTCSTRPVLRSARIPGTPRFMPRSSNPRRVGAIAGPTRAPSIAQVDGERRRSRTRAGRGCALLRLRVRTRVRVIRLFVRLRLQFHVQGSRLGDPARRLPVVDEDVGGPVHVSRHEV